MKKIIFLILGLNFLSFLLVAQEENGEKIDTAYKFILDYDVPESPAFAVLDINPNSVMRGSAAKPVVVNLGNQLINGGKVENGIALDFNPYFSILGGRVESIKDYWKKDWKRLLANMQWSLATSSLEDYPNDIVYGIGSRFTLFDEKDLLRNEKYREAIDNELGNDEEDPVVPEAEELIQDIELGKIKEKINELREKKGFAASIGWAMSGRLKNGILKSDSIKVLRNQIWLSCQYSLGKGYDILALAMQRFEAGQSALNQTRLGIAARMNQKNFTFSGELIYKIDDIEKRFDGGFNVGIRVLPRVMYVFNLATQDDANPDSSKKNLVVRSSLKWNFSESYSDR